MIADTPQVFFPDFNTFILFKLLPDKRIQFIKAAAAGSLSNILVFHLKIGMKNMWKYLYSLWISYLDKLPHEGHTILLQVLYAVPYPVCRKPYENI